MKELITIPFKVKSSITAFFLLSCLPSASLFAQNNPVTDLTYYATEDVKTQNPPSFPGGHEKLEEFIRNEVDNSPNEIKLGRKVHITAKINESGKVIELKPAFNADPPLEKELQRIAILMPTWQAGTVNGKGVITDYTFVLKRN